MKNKRAKLNEDNKKPATLINPLNKNVNLKNREQLRKKLKGLLEKDKSNVHLLTSNASIVQNAEVKDNQKNIPQKKVLNNKTTKGNKATVKTPLVIKIPQVTADNSQSLKRKKQQHELSNKATVKTAQVSKQPNNNCKTLKTRNKKHHQKLSKRELKSSPNTATNLKTPRKATPLNGKGPILLKKKAKKIVTPQKKKLPGKQSIAKQVKPVERVKSNSKKPKPNTYKGPLRPSTPESDSEDKLSVPPTEPPKKRQKPNRKKEKKTINTELALTRVSCDDKEHSSDGSYVADDDYYSEDYECSSTDDCTYYSDDDSSDSLVSDGYDEDDGDDNEDDDYDENSSCWSDTPSSESCLYYDSKSDETYELPDDVAEDVYVANGTAVKHDLSENNEINFDSDTSTAQVIEIPPSPDKTPTVAAPANQISKSNISFKQLALEKATESDDSCPELVPIDFTNHNHEGCHSDSDSCCECMSFSGTDTEFDSASAYSEDSGDLPQMTPGIFQADKAEKQDFDIPFFQTTNGPAQECLAGSPLDRIANSKSTTALYKVITINNQVVNPDSEVNGASKSTKSKQIEKSQLKKPQREKPQLEKPQLEKPQLEKPNNIESYSLTSELKILYELKSPSVETSPADSQNIDTPTSSISPANREKVPTPMKTQQNKPSCRTLFFNAINSNQVIVLLKDPLYIYGTVKLKLIAGSLEIFGYNPKQNETLEIFSPRGYSSLRMLPVKPTNPCTSLKDLLSLTPFFISNDLEEVVEKFDDKKDAIVILERNDRSKKVNMLKKYMIEDLFPNMNAQQSDRPFYTSEFLLRCILTTKTDKALLVDPRWRTITVTNHSKVVVIGGKSVGKSTLVRYLINKNLNLYPKILLIDLDIGQPEIFVPQTVSATTLSTPLLGPGYFLNKEPDKAFLVGQTNVVLLPQRYIENVQALVEYCKGNEAYRDIPWIVNTMGYNKGFGDELIAIISDLIHPTNIVQLESRKEINNFDYIMSNEVIQSMERNITGDMFCSGDVCRRPQHQLTIMDSVIPTDRNYQKEWDMNPRDMRLAMILSRLSAIIKGYADWLTDIKPVSASIDDLTFVNLGDDEISRENILQALIGNLVYLCRQNPAASKQLECFGIGIVRGVDFNLKQIYLLPAVPLDVLTNVNCLAVCGIPLPSSILINQGPKVKGVASYVYNTVDRPATMYIKQIYNRPQHFLTPSRKNHLVE